MVSLEHISSSVSHVEAVSHGYERLQCSVQLMEMTQPNQVTPVSQQMILRI